MYRPAVARVSAIITAITGLESPDEYGKQFKRVPSDLEGKPMTSRSFMLRALGHATDSRSQQSALTRWTPSPVIARFLYLPRPGKRDDLDVIMASDYVKIRDALMDSGDWDRPSSRIVNLSTDEPNIFPATIQDSDEVIIMDLALDLVHTEQAA